MFPYLYQAPDGGVSVPTYGAMIMLAFIAATTVGFFRLRKVGIHPDILPGIVSLAIVFGILGARLLHFLGSEPADFFSNPLILFKLNEGGMAVYGGVLAAGLACFLYAKRQEVHPWKLTDALMPCFFLALAIGRLGCLAAGCCFGANAGSEIQKSLTGDLFSNGALVTVNGPPWVAAVYSGDSSHLFGAQPGLPCYPTQIWESLAALTLFGLLSWTWASRRKFDGQILAIGMLLYPAIRSTIERFRGDMIRGTDHFGLFSTSQVVSFGVALVALWIWKTRSPHGLAPEIEIEKEDDLDPDLFEDSIL